MFQEITASDPNESVVFILQLLELRVFDVFDDLILEDLFHCIRMFL